MTPTIDLSPTEQALFRATVCLAALLALCGVGKCDSSAKDREQFAGLTSEYLSANRHHDSASLASLTTQDFILVWPGHYRIDLLHKSPRPERRG